MWEILITVNIFFKKYYFHTIKIPKTFFLTNLNTFFIVFGAALRMLD